MFLKTGVLGFYALVSLLLISRLSWYCNSLLLMLFSITYVVLRITFKTRNLFGPFVFFNYQQSQSDPIVIDKCRKTLKEEATSLRDDVSVNSSFQCLLCGEYQCSRHSEENHAQLRPWFGLQLNNQVNTELELLLDAILNQYIRFWYDELQAYAKNEKQFETEIRILLKHVVAICIKRMRTLDTQKLISTKLLPALIQNFYVYLDGKRSSKSQQFIENSVLRKYHQLGLYNSHIRSEAEEKKWLRTLSELLLPFLIPPKLLCSGIARLFLRELLACAVLKTVIDTATDPLYLNEILWLVFAEQSPTNENVSNQQNYMVDLLNNFCKNEKDLTKSSFSKTMGISMENVLKDQKMLFFFLQFLKEEGSVNLLQFILTIDSFNEKILNPELSKNDRKELHADAQQILVSYILPSSYDYVGCVDDQCAEDLCVILDKGPNFIEEMRTKDTLFKAYEQVYAYLEQNYLSLFFESDYFCKLIVGPRICIPMDKNLNDQSPFSEYTPSCTDLMGNEERLSSDTDDEEETSEIDEKGQDYIFEYGIDLLDLINNSNDLSVSDDTNRHPITISDLSKLRISIEKVETKLEDNSYKYFYVYLIRVMRTDVYDEAFSINEELDIDEQIIEETLKESSENKEPNFWYVERKYDEFYVLNEKLKKFHGAALESQVTFPSKRTLFKQSLGFLESRKHEFEKYLQKLISITCLQRSELLCNFLQPISHQRKEEIFNSKIVGLNIKKMIKTMPAKFSQEKGQHLEPFLLSFIASTEAQKTRGNMPDLKDIFGDNSEFEPDATGDSTLQFETAPQLQSYEQKPFKSIWIYDYLVYFITRVCIFRKMNDLLAHVLKLLQPLLKKSVQSLFSYFLQNRIQQLLTPCNLCSALQQLRTVLLNSEQRVKPQSAAQQAQKSLQAMQAYFDNLLRYVPAIGDSQQIAFFLHSALQHQMLNKQLMYLMLNLILEDAFPEIMEKRTVQI